MAIDSRQTLSSGAPWESVVGYSRAIRIGRVIEVAGTCALDENGEAFAPSDPYLQTKRILEIIESAITALGGSMKDVVRTRIFVTQIVHWPEIGRAHGEVFHAIRPVTSMVEVARLISPDHLVEIEATAILSD